jgi:uncharacterized protein
MECATLSERNDEQVQPPPVAVPYTALSEDVLRRVVESFVLREGTDYGEREVTHEAKVSQVIAQLARGEAAILFDPVTASIDIVLTRPGRR